MDTNKPASSFLFNLLKHAFVLELHLNFASPPFP
jgi:hypothetical protein